MRRKQTTTSTTGMILGRFMPPHLGHQYLLDFARSFVDHLTIIVYSQGGEPLSGDMRCAWLHEMCPEAEILQIVENLPQTPQEHPDYWILWHDSIRQVLPAGPDYFLSSEEDGWKLAELLKSTYIPVDHTRSLIPISGVLIRENPMATWEYLPTCVRPYFVRRVCVFGLEATGRSTLSRRLAAYYGTSCVNEYATSFQAFKENSYDREDIALIAKGQIASEYALARQANRLLFSDTDLITTILLSEHLFGDCPQWIRDEAVQHQYDLYLLTDINVPWSKEHHQGIPGEREALFNRCIQELESRKCRYVKIGGTWKQRFHKACQEVDRLLEE